MTLQHPEYLILDAKAESTKNGWSQKLVDGQRSKQGCVASRPGRRPHAVFALPPIHLDLPRSSKQTSTTITTPICHPQSSIDFQSRHTYRRLCQLTNHFRYRYVHVFLAYRSQSASSLLPSVCTLARTRPHTKESMLRNSHSRSPVWDLAPLPPRSFPCHHSRRAMLFPPFTSASNAP